MRIRPRFGAGALLTATSLAVSALGLPLPAAHAAAALTITPITWNVLGIDKVNPDEGPNLFPAGARICNTGSTTAHDVVATFSFTTTSSFIALSGPSSIRKGDLLAGRCVDAYFEVRVDPVEAAIDATRGYRITASADDAASVSTPSPRELYVQKLISQARNEVLSIAGPTQVYVGRTYTFDLTSETAPGGYEQLETHLTFPAGIFEIISVQTTYSAPPGATNDAMYADACGWDEVPTSPTYLDCVGPENYAGGKAGGDIFTRYTVRVRGTGTASLSGLIYDKSGESYHYNADYAEGLNLLVVTAVEPPDLRLGKSHVGAAWPVDTDQVWTISVRNIGGVATTGTTVVTDTMPAGARPLSATGSGWTCSIAGQGVTCRRSAPIAAGATSTIAVSLRVASNAPATLANTARVTTPDDGDPANNVARDVVPVSRPADPTEPGTDPTDPTDPGAGPGAGPGADPSAGPLTPRANGPGQPAPGRVGGLPYTGAPTDSEARHAFVLLVAGALVLMAGHRRPSPAVVRRRRNYLVHGGE